MRVSGLHRGLVNRSLLSRSTGGSRYQLLRHSSHERNEESFAEFSGPNDRVAVRTQSSRVAPYTLDLPTRGTVGVLRACRVVSLQPENTWSTELVFQNRTQILPCYRVLDPDGIPVDGKEPEASI